MEDHKIFTRNYIADIIPKVLLNRPTCRSSCFNTLIFVNSSALMHYVVICTVGALFSFQLFIFAARLIQSIFTGTNTKSAVLPLIWILAELLAVCIVSLLILITDLKRKAWFIWHLEAVGKLVVYGVSFSIMILILCITYYKLKQHDEGVPFSQISWYSIIILTQLFLIAISIKLAL